MRSHLPVLRRAGLLGCLLLLTADPAPAQGSGALPDDLAKLAARVDRAHHPHGPVAEVTQFKASLDLRFEAADADQGGQVDLDVRYMRWQRPDDNRIRHLIRYEVKHAGAPIERGRDEFGFWHLVQGKASPLTEADATDRAACVRDTNLARQLVRFLDPGAVLRELAAPGPVTKGDLGFGREKGVPCETVEGDLPAFPLLRRAGDDAPARVKVYVTAAEGRLHGLLVRPIVDGKPDETQAEMIRLSDAKEAGGLLIPKRIEHWFRDEAGNLRKQSRVLVTTLDLEPKLTVDSLARPK